MGFQTLGLMYVLFAAGYAILFLSPFPILLARRQRSLSRIRCETLPRLL